MGFQESALPRAKRNYAIGYAWHITHRCHDRSFLLRFQKDRSRWRYWLFQARKRYGLCVLNYIVTSNHIHLLVYEHGRGSIARSMQLIAGRVAQEYNQRKGRRGAFWEDRYFATAVATDEHLLECLVYIDLNMVRAGVVSHPSQWPTCGFNEIQSPPVRYRVIDMSALTSLTGVVADQSFRSQHRAWVERKLEQDCLDREACWTENDAVGSERYRKEFLQRKASLRQ